MKKNYRDTARDLKRLGLVDYDLRKPLSSGQKSRITKLREEYEHFLKSPEQFHFTRVGKETARALADTGYKVLPGNRALIPLHEAQSASIKGGKITLNYGRMKEEITLAGHKSFFPTLKELSGKKLKRNQMLTVAIGDNNAFQRARFGSYHELYKYIQEWEPKDPYAKKKKLMAQMSIVTVEIEEPKRAKKKAPAKKARGNRRRNRPV